MRLNGSIEKNRDVIIFLHVPKSAGTTLNLIIVWEYSPFRICSVDGRFPRWAFRRISGWKASRLDRSDIFTGHMPFGLHRALPRKADYITVLRDPVERVISEYYYRVGRKSHPLADREIKGFSLSDYVEKLPYGNVQTKLLAGGNPDYDFMAGECTAKMLDLAKQNLAEFKLVGLTERFIETLALARLILGWKIESYASMRVTAGKPNNDVPPSLRDLIAAKNSYDIELYKFGREIFERSLEQNRQQLNGLAEELRVARLPEGVQSRWYGFTTTARRWIIRFRSDL